MNLIIWLSRQPSFIVEKNLYLLAFPYFFTMNNLISNSYLFLV